MLLLSSHLLTPTLLTRLLRISFSFNGSFGHYFRGTVLLGRGRTRFHRFTRIRYLLLRPEVLDDTLSASSRNQEVLVLGQLLFHVLTWRLGSTVGTELRGVMEVESQVVASREWPSGCLDGLSVNVVFLLFRCVGLLPLLVLLVGLVEHHDVEFGFRSRFRLDDIASL